MGYFINLIIMAQIFESLQMGVPGVALGLAWTQVGGKVGNQLLFLMGNREAR